MQEHKTEDFQLKFTENEKLAKNKKKYNKDQLHLIKKPFSKEISVIKKHCELCTSILYKPVLHWWHHWFRSQPCSALLQQSQSAPTSPEDDQVLQYPPNDYQGFTVATTAVSNIV